MKAALKFVTLVGICLTALLAIPAGAAVPPTLSTEHLPLIAFGGLLVNKASLDAAFLSIKTLFNNAFSKAETVWPKIAMLVPSGTGQNIYAWLSKFPRMRKWVGDKHIKALEAFKYTVVNDDFEVTIEVDRNDIEDDTLGVYKPQAEMAGESSAQLPDEIVFDLVNNGFTSTCFDGQFFFDTDHVVQGASVSNKGTAVLTITTLAAAQASYGAYRTAMKKFKDDEGRPLNIKPNVLLVGPALEDTANALMTNDRLEDGKPNPYKGTATVVCDGRITSDTAWFLLDTSKPVKPFIYQERKAPVFVNQIDPQADGVFMRKKFLFGAEARAAGGYGFWQLAFGSTGTP